MPRTKSKIKCTKCNTIGGTLSKRWVKRNVNIPKIENIKTISEAWDYSGKIFLRIRELQILFPPSSDDFDDLKDMFAQFEMLCPLSREDFEVFINRNISTISKNALYKKEIMEKKEGIKFHRFVLPKTSGKITRLSVSSLYCAIICFSLRDIFEISGEINHQYQYAKSICNIFRFFYLSLRNTISKLKWANIIEDINEYGYNAAAFLNSIPTNICVNCSNIRKKEKELVFLEEIGRSNNEKVIFKCPKCGKSNRRKRKFSTQYLKQTYQKKSQEFIDVINSLEDYDEFINRYGKYIKTVFAEQFLEYFESYEKNAKKDLLTKKEYYVIGHYDSNKKYKKRWCIIKNLADIEIDDQRYYSEYIPTFKRMIQFYKNNFTNFFNDFDFEEKVEKILIDIGWPPKYAQDKVHADCMKIVLYNVSNIG